jgi:hypothetical protein
VRDDHYLVFSQDTIDRYATKLVVERHRVLRRDHGRRFDVGVVSGRHEARAGHGWDEGNRGGDESTTARFHWVLVVTTP